MAIRLRAATQCDAPLLSRWDHEPHVMAATDEPPEADWSSVLTPQPSTEWLIAEDDGRAVGVILIIDPAQEPTGYWGDAEPNLRAIDIWIGPADALGRGIGTQMMRQALARCFAEDEVRAVLVDPLASNVRAHRFYERCGFTRIGRRLLQGSDCMVYRLDRSAWRARWPDRSGSLHRSG